MKKIRRRKVSGRPLRRKLQLNMPLESAGSRPVIVGNSKEPRTRHPVAFTANRPHRDAGMKEPRYLRGRRKESGVERSGKGVRRLCA